MKKRLRMMLAAMVIAAMLVTAGCGSGVTTYDTGKGLPIAMARGLQPQDSQDFDILYAGADCAMAATIDGFDQLASAGYEPTTMTLTEYADVLRSLNGMDETFTADAEGFPCASYQSTVDGTDYFYYMTLRKGTDAFWIVTFFCLASVKDTYLGQFKSWSSSIKIN